MCVIFDPSPNKLAITGRRGISVWFWQYAGWYSFHCNLFQLEIHLDFKLHLILAFKSRITRINISVSWSRLFPASTPSSLIGLTWSAYPSHHGQTFKKQQFRAKWIASLQFYNVLEMHGRWGVMNLPRQCDPIVWFLRCVALHFHVYNTASSFRNLKFCRLFCNEMTTYPSSSIKNRDASCH